MLTEDIKAKQEIILITYRRYNNIFYFTKIIMGTCSITCHIYGNDTLNKYENNMSISKDETEIKENPRSLHNINTDQISSSYNEQFNTAEINDYIDSTQNSLDQSSRPVRKEQLNPLDMLKMVQDHHNPYRIQEEREKLIKERQKFEQDKHIHQIQETFKKAYKESSLKSSNSRK